MDVELFEKIFEVLFAGLGVVLGVFFTSASMVPSATQVRVLAMMKMRSRSPIAWCLRCGLVLGGLVSVLCS